MREFSIFLLSLSLVFFGLKISAQVDSSRSLPCHPQYFSANGYNLPAKGVFRILVVFGEIEYANPNDDPALAGNLDWPAHQLPAWANQLGNPFPPENIADAVGLTEYFLRASSGEFIVLTDFLINPKNQGIFAVPNADISELVNKVNEQMNHRLVTANGLNDIAHFDLWTLGTKDTGPGLPKLSPSDESPRKYDHVMFIWRNKKNNDNTGASYSYDFRTPLLGFSANTHSINTAFSKMPLKLLRHEFSHLLLGGNNFHCGGGGHAAGGYFQHLTGGWSILGLHDSALQTWNAWDRKRLGWKVAASPFEISAQNVENTKFINADLDAANSNHAGIYVLRDFASTGDALRIKLPFLDAEKEFEQFLWIENHQGFSFNGISHDRWQYESEEIPCVQGLNPGMLAYIQIDRENSSACSANELYSGYADYLRPLPANGFWDREVLKNEEFNDCVQYAETKAYKRIKENSLTGSSDLDRLMVNLNNNEKLEFNEVSTLFNYVEKTGLDFHKHLFALGHSRQIFTPNGNSKISVSSNPSSANMINMVRNGGNPVIGAKNVRRIYLNGISVEIIGMKEGNLTIKVRFDDVEVDKNTRWCADEIVLNPIPNSEYSLVVKSKTKIEIDRSLTFTRMDKPELYNGKQLFNSKSTFRVLKNAQIKMESKSQLNILNGSYFVLESGSSLTLLSGAQLRISKGSIVEIKKDAKILKHKKAKITVEKGGQLIIDGELQQFP